MLEEVVCMDADPGGKDFKTRKKQRIIKGGTNVKRSVRRLHKSSREQENLT